MKKLWILIPFLILFPFVFSKVTSHFDRENFEKFVQQVRIEARQKGISPKTIDTYLSNLTPPKRKALFTLTHQAQATLTFQRYLKNFVSDSSIRRGKIAMKKHHDILQAVEKVYGVQPQYIIALWSIETDFGKLQGKDNIVHALVILSYQDHRADFYRKQLFAMLKILDHQKIPEQAYGTWDGGMGQTSFEPTIYQQYAVDFDKDGFKNIWTSLPDVFASIANFLKQNGWKAGEEWGYPVKLPAHFNRALAGRDKKQIVAFWKKQGVTQLDGTPLPTRDAAVSAILLPANQLNPAYLVLNNFFVLLRWNNTTFEGLSVGILADKIK